MSRNFWFTGILLGLFCLFTALVMNVDVQPIGPQHSTVGLASLNQMIHQAWGVNLLWYDITNGLGVAALLVALGFGGVGMVQLMRRKSLFKIDFDIILLGVYYIVVMAAYVFFEFFIVNYRPIIMSEELQASFPSSHTMMVLCIMGTSLIQFQKRIKNKIIRNAAQVISILLIAVTIIGRILSGVHWFTDIIAGLLLASALIMLYYSLYKMGEHSGAELGEYDSPY